MYKPKEPLVVGATRAGRSRVEAWVVMSVIAGTRVTVGWANAAACGPLFENLCRAIGWAEEQFAVARRCRIQCGW